MTQQVTATLSRKAQDEFYYKRYETLSKLEKQAIMSIGILGDADIKDVIVDISNPNKSRKYGVMKAVDKSGKPGYMMILPGTIQTQLMDSFQFAVLMFVEACRYKQMESLIPHFNLSVWQMLRRKSLENLKTIDKTH